MLKNLNKTIEEVSEFLIKNNVEFSEYQYKEFKRILKNLHQIKIDLKKVLDIS